MVSYFSYILAMSVVGDKTYVVENKLERRSAQRVPIDDSEVSFPQLMEEQLRCITFGVYQWKLSSSYIQ